MSAIMTSGIYLLISFKYHDTIAIKSIAVLAYGNVQGGQYLCCTM